MANTTYLKYDADSMVEFLRNSVTASGQFTDQLYAGGNMSIILETLAAMYEVLVYQQNFAASEASFTSVSIYENMLKILSQIGYKPRLCISSTVLCSLTGNINLSILNNATDGLTETSTIGQLITNIENQMKYITSSKVLTKDLSISDTTSTYIFTVNNNVLTYPSIKYDDESSIFYLYKSRGRSGILQYLSSIWSGSIDSETLAGLSEEDTLSELISDDGIITSISDLYIVNNSDTIAADFIVSANADDNYVMFMNGAWHSYYITDYTVGMQLEEYVMNVNVEQYLPCNNTLYALIYDPEASDIKSSIEIWTGVRNLRDYTSVDKVFSYGVNTEKTITLQFGDGIHGQLLEPNKTIVVYYMQSDGEGAQISKNNFATNSSLFTNTVIETTLSSVSNNVGNDTAKILTEKFYYDNLKTITENDNQKTSTVISQLISSDSKADPKITLYANVLNNASAFQPLESIEYMRAAAPAYNRTNNRIVTRNDLTTYMTTEFSDTIYDVSIMNNWDYMQSFYTWLYKHNKLSKSIRTYGYKFADACDFNNIYIWVKGYTKFVINDFYKKSIEQQLLHKKPLTAEPVILDTFNTNFYPYVGNIYDDIVWLKKCYDFYKFSNNTAGVNRLEPLFSKKNGEIELTLNTKLIDYILTDSSDNKEIKIQIDLYRDTNASTNLASVTNDVSDTITEFFKVENHKLGENFNTVKLNEDIYKIPGISKIVTNKLYNIGIYNTLPFNTPYTYNEYEGITSEFPVVYNIPQKYDDSRTGSKYTGNCVLELVSKINDDSIDLNNEDYDRITWYKRNLITNSLTKLTFIKATNGTWTIDNNNSSVTEIKINETVTIDGKQQPVEKSYYYIGTGDGDISFYFDGLSFVQKTVINTTDPNNEKTLTYNCIDIDDETGLSDLTKCFYNMQIDYDNIKSSKMSIYAEYSKTINSNNISYKTNTTIISFIGVNNNAGSTNHLSRADSYVLTNELDSYATSFISGNQNTWESVESTNMISFAKWNSKIMNGEDFEVIGSGIVKMEPFCFPILYKNITINAISIKEDNLESAISLEY